MVGSNRITEVDFDDICGDFQGPGGNDVTTTDNPAQQV